MATKENGMITTGGNNNNNNNGGTIGGGTTNKTEADSRISRQRKLQHQIRRETRKKKLQKMMDKKRKWRMKLHMVRTRLMSKVYSLKLQQ